MTEDHDKSYRLLFSFPRMVEDLIRLFVGGKWLHRLDFSTLEKVSERDVSPELVRREKDLLWRVKIRPGAKSAKTGGWFYVFLHFEFQSEPAPFMALRVLTYRALLWEDLIRQKALTASGKLPPILSVVLYNGDRPWTGPTSLGELIEPWPDAPAGTDPLSYRLIDERQLAEADLVAGSPVTGLFQLERSHDFAELADVARKLRGDLEGDDNQQLRDALDTFLAVKIRRLHPDLDPQPTIGFTDMPSMLDARIDQWIEEWKHEGREEGRDAGLLEGQARLLSRQLELKFGPLPARIARQLEAAEDHQLLAWGERLLTADRLDDVFANDSPSADVGSGQ